MLAETSGHTTHMLTSIAIQAVDTPIAATLQVEGPTQRLTFRIRGDPTPEGSRHIRLFGPLTRTLGLARSRSRRRGGGGRLAPVALPLATRSSAGSGPSTRMSFPGKQELLNGSHAKYGGHEAIQGQGTISPWRETVTTLFRQAKVDLTITSCDLGHVNPLVALRRSALISIKEMEDQGLMGLKDIRRAIA